MEGGEREEDPLESSVARLPGRGAAAPGWTRPATGTGKSGVLLLPIAMICINSPTPWNNAGVRDYVMDSGEWSIPTTYTPMENPRLGLCLT